MFILWLGDQLGRRLSIMIGAAVMIIGVLIQVTAYPGHVPLAQFIVGRVITGVGNGINTSTIPTYQAECSRTSNRGLLICIEGGVIAFGSLIAYWIDFGASYGPDDLTWRFPIAFQIFFGLVIVIGMTFLPESPRWLCMKERYEEGETVIAALMGKEVSSHEVQLQKSIVLDSIRAYVSSPSSKYTRLTVALVRAKLELLYLPFLREGRRNTFAVCFWVLHRNSCSKLAAAMQ